MIVGGLAFAAAKLVSHRSPWTGSRLVVVGVAWEVLFHPTLRMTAITRGMNLSSYKDHLECMEVERRWPNKSARARVQPGQR